MCSIGFAPIALLVGCGRPPGSLLQVVVGMCDSLSLLRTSVLGFAAKFDVTALCGDDAASIVSDAAAIEASAAALKALAASIAIDAGAFATAGARSPTDGLARAVGMGTVAARELVTTGRRLGRQSELSRLARAGQLSREQVALVADASEVAPGAAAELLAGAMSQPLAGLRDLAQRTKAAARDPEERRRAIRSRRSLRSFTDPEGIWHLSAVGNPEDGAHLVAAMEPWRAARFEAARKEGEREQPEAYAFDALIDLAKAVASGEHVEGGRAPDERSAGGAGGAGGAGTAEPTMPRADGHDAEDGAVADHEGGPAASHPAERRPTRPGRTGAPVKLLVRIDYDTFLRGFPTAGETCELVGSGPIAVSAVRDLMATGDPFVAAILTRAKKVIGVAHLGRRPSAHQQSALEWLYPSCAAADCQTRVHLEADHREDWAATHFTALDLLDLLCRHHHGLKTRENWALVDGVGAGLRAAR
jgi:hypothetical protein